MTTKTGIIYLQKDKLQLYSPYLGTILELRFVPQIVRDLDVINQESLEALIKAFVTNGKISPSNLIILLADNTYFVKDFVLPPEPAKLALPAADAPKLTMQDAQDAADKFVEHVPYENVVSKSFPLKNGIKICAANQDFYEAVRTGFEKLGFVVDLVIPGLVLGNNLSAKPVLDLALATGTIQKASTLKQYNLLMQDTFQPETHKASENSEQTELEEPQNKNLDKKRLFALVGVFTTLIIVLVIVYAQSQTPPTPPQQPVQAQTPVSEVKPASTVITAIPTVGGQVPSASTLTVQITTASDSEALAQNLQKQLTHYSFKRLTIQTKSGVSTSSTVVSFSGNTPQVVRNTVIDEVKKIKTDITVQERQDDSVDILIILGK